MLTELHTRFARLGGMLTLVAACGLGVTSLAVLPGCDDNNAEDAADNIGDAMDDAGDAVQDAAEDTADSIEDATN